jgi:hypothetical protein
VKTADLIERLISLLFIFVLDYLCETENCSDPGDEDPNKRTGTVHIKGLFVFFCVYRVWFRILDPTPYLANPYVESGSGGYESDLSVPAVFQRQVFRVRFRIRGSGTAPLGSAFRIRIRRIRIRPVDLGYAPVPGVTLSDVFSNFCSIISVGTRYRTIPVPNYMYGNLNVDWIGSGSLLR